MSGVVELKTKRGVVFELDYHDSQGWRTAQITDSLELELSNWDRYADRKSWSATLYTYDTHTSSAVLCFSVPKGTDLECCEYALRLVESWLADQIKQLKKQRRVG